VFQNHARHDLTQPVGAKQAWGAIGPVHFVSMRRSVVHCAGEYQFPLINAIVTKSPFPAPRERQPLQRTPPWHTDPAAIPDFRGLDIAPEGDVFMDFIAVMDAFYARFRTRAS
jgi:hypothetical protein